MPSQETVHVSPMEVTPTLGKGTLGTQSFHRSSIRRWPDTASARSLRREMELGSGQTRSSLGRMRIGA